jgi:hypothetical protein
MASEFEELQLQVSFVDNATPQLRALLGEVSKMNDLTSRVSQGTRDMSESTRRFGTELSQVSKLLTDITKLPIGSILGAGGIAGVAYGIKAMNDQLSVFSREMLNLQNNSRIAGILPDQFKNIASQLRQVGFSTEEADKTLIGFMRTVDEASRVGTAQFQKIFVEARNPTLMLQHIQRWKEMIGRGQGAKALEEAAAIGRQIFERELTKPGGSRAEATRQMQAYFESLDLPMKAADIKSIPDIVGDPEKWQKRIAAAQSFNKEYEKFNETTADIGAEMKTTLLPAFEDLNNWLVTTGASWTKWIPEQLKVELGTIRQIVQLLSGDLKGLKGSAGGIQVTPGSIADVSIYGTPGQVQGPPTAFGQPPVDPINPAGVQTPGGTELTPDQAERLQRRYRGRTRAAGGPVAGGGPYIVGERGPEVFVPGSSGTIMANLGNEGPGSSEQKEIIEDETDQRKQLTTNLKQINDLLESGDLGPLSVRSGTGAGAGWGYGRAGSGTPGGAPSGSGTPGTPGGGPSAGTHGGPGGPPATPYAPAGTQPATLPGSTASTGYPTGGGFTSVPNLMTASGQNPPGAAGDPNAPLPGGTGSSAIYNKLLTAYQNSGLVGTIPTDGARYGFKTGSAEEWARFGMIIAAAESDYNPRTAVSNAREQSFGIFQYNHPQVPGGNAFDVDASVKQFVEDSKSSMKTHGNLGPGSLLYRRFSTIQNTPPPSRARQADAEIAAARRQGVQPPVSSVAPSAVTTLKTRATEPGQEAAIPPGLLDPTRMAPPSVVGGQPQMPRADTGFVSPVSGAPVLSEFATPRSSPTGKHQGIDIGNTSFKGAPIVTTTSDQKIIQSGHLGTNYGWGVKTIDSQGRMHVYAHMIEDPTKTHNLKVGETLGQGHQIGRVGNSGNAASTPSHVHYEIRPPGGSYAASYNPRRFLPPLRGEPGYQPPGAPSVQTAGPPQVGTTGGPKIETLRTTPDPNLSSFNPFGNRDVDEGGEVASGKRGAPWFGGVAAGKGGPYLGGVAAGKGRGAGGTGFIDRSVMDGVQGRSVFHRVRGRGSVDVTIKKSEDSRSTPITGPFKKIRMHGQRQNEPAASGPPEATAANHDPGLDS